MSHDVWSIVVVIGLAGWIASSIMLAFKAFPKKDVFDAVSGRCWGGAVVFSFCVWIIGILMA